MKVYHGTTLILEHPLVSAGRPHLDFGQGFYVTDIQQQAESWANRIRRIRLTSGVVNVYEFDLDKAKSLFSYYKFEKYDNEWLQFIVANRMGRDDIPHYDIIEGGVANDRVIDTVEGYMSNLMSLENALKELSKHSPNNQICISTQQVIEDCLKFIDFCNI